MSTDLVLFRYSTSQVDIASKFFLIFLSSVAIAKPGVQPCQSGSRIGSVGQGKSLSESANFSAAHFIGLRIVWIAGAQDFGIENPLGLQRSHLSEVRKFNGLLESRLVEWPFA